MDLEEDSERKEAACWTERLEQCEGCSQRQAGRKEECCSLMRLLLRREMIMMTMTGSQSARGKIMPSCARLICNLCQSSLYRCFFSSSVTIDVDKGKFTARLTF